VKRPLFALLVFAAVSAVVAAGYSAVVQTVASRIKAKGARVEAGLDTWVKEGNDPAPIVAVLKGVMPALDAGDPTTAEALLDRAIGMLGASAPRDVPQPADSLLPVVSAVELASGLYTNPQPVSIEGYDLSAMEPFIAPDGRTLFFNNVNDPGVDTNLHMATRVGTRAFRYVGEVVGVNSPVLDAVPSMDVDGRFYFTSVRQYDRDLKSIFAGTFAGRTVRDARPVEGSLTPSLPGHLNMDASVSPDGQTLYISRARFAGGRSVPRESDLLIARRAGDAFMLDPRNDELLAHVNTPALEYAPAISADGLELYFTRASQLMAGRDGQGAKLRIMVARRPRADAPFDAPRVLEALDGFVEAPSLSLDGREMFFHKKVEGRFVIHRAERRSGAR
jgi:hypothetical protein